MVAGCTALPSGSTETSTLPSTSSTTSSTTMPTTTAPSCEGEFSERGELLTFHVEGDANRISALHTDQDGACEQFVIGFTTQAGAPATSVGNVDVEFLRDIGVIRIALPNIAHTSITDGVFESPLVDRAYVVRAQDGSLYVDAHLSAPAMARAEIVQSPARVVVQLEPGGEELPAPAPRSDLVVLLAPREAEVSYPLTVSGYARTFEANVVVRILQGGSIVAERVTTATDYLEAWGEFSSVFESGPVGQVQLVVGEDGDQEVVVDLVVN
jgi:hypothetical protein